MTKQKEVCCNSNKKIYVNFFFFAVDLYYIGPGKRNTGDWCFEDGFITFRDLTHLYLQLLRGRVLNIVTDCSHSGCWVKQCMTFLDEQGVGPCGHLARDKGILISIFASCMSHQIPRQLAFSVHGCKNDKNTGDLIARTFSRIHPESKVADAQHLKGINFTQVRCGEDSIQDKCLCLPQANWQTWSTIERIHTVTVTDRGTWHMVMFVDDDETIVYFLEREHIDLEDYGQVLKSGKGNGPTNEERASIIKPYEIYQAKPKH